jgi:hypothetical protein
VELISQLTVAIDGEAALELHALTRTIGFNSSGAQRPCGTALLRAVSTHPRDFLVQPVMSADGEGGGSSGQARKLTWKQWLERADSGDAEALFTIAGWHADRKVAAAAGVQPPFVPKVGCARCIWLHCSRLVHHFVALANTHHVPI